MVNMYKEIEALFWNNFLSFCKKNNTTPTNVAKSLGISPGNVTAWKNGRIPKWATLVMISDFFDTSPDILIADTSEHLTNAVQGNTINGNYNVVGNGSQIAVGAELTAQEQELITYFRKLGETDKAKALLYVAETLGADNP